MGQGKTWLQRLTEGMDLPAEAIPGQPVVELAGENRVLIENHKGVTQYSTEQICIRVSFGWISVSGCGLCLMRMTAQQLVIGGRIDGVAIHRRER